MRATWNHRGISACEEAYVSKRLLRIALVGLAALGVSADLALVYTRGGPWPSALGLTRILGTAPPTPYHCASADAGAPAPAPSPPNVRVSSDNFVAHSEPMLAENLLNPLNLVGGSKYFTNLRRYAYKIGTYASFDGGCTWLESGLLPGTDAYHYVSDVSIAFGPGGEVYAAVLVVGRGTNDTYSGIAVFKSLDGGRTFAPPTLVYADPSGNTFHDKPWITVDRTHGPHRGNVYVAWTDNAIGSPIVFSRSLDGGATWSAPLAISGSSPVCTIARPDLDPADHLCANSEGATPVVLPDGTLVVAFAYADLAFFAPDAGHRAPPIPTRLLVVSSRDGGKSWSAPVLAATVVDPPFELPRTTFRNLLFPALAVDPHRGWIYLAWSDERFGDSDVLLERSTDAGYTWSAPVRVNDDPRGDGTDQFQPQLAVAPDGTLAVSFFDRRLDPGNRLVDTYVAQSIDGGLTFLPNQRASSRSWDTDRDAPYPDVQAAPDATFIGDYQGLAMDNAWVHPFWNDARDGTQQIYTATLPAARAVATGS
jgi:hypothetical protein